jgi:hypothetical protein
MSRKGDFLPSKDSDFDAWYRHFCQYVNSKCIPVPPATVAEWTHIPAANRTALNDGFSVWHAAYLVTSSLLSLIPLSCFFVPFVVIFLLP